MTSSPRNEELGDRIRRYREEKGLSLSELALRANVSKGYLSTIENDPHRKRPSAQTLYAVAKALGVAMSDLLGERLIIDTPSEVSPSLRAFAKEASLPRADIEMLASIQFRGDRPQTSARWRHIYDAIRMSRALDA
jgi:transcriptional regulator with XRE-family HTH domain